MARSIQQIQDSLIAEKGTNPVLAALLTNPSAAAIWLLWTYIVAVCQNVLETLFDDHVEEVDSKIKAEMPHTMGWYETKSRAFQLGYDINPLTGEYDEISEAAQIVKHVAAKEQVPYVRLKLAKAVGDGLGALSATEMAAFTAYMNLQKDGGVRLWITSNDADDLQVSFAIYYNPLVLDENGARLDGTAATPVLDAVKAFVKAIPFNNLLVINKLVATIEAIDGVEICEPTFTAARYGELPFTEFVTEYAADAGYLVVDAGYFNDNTTYTPHIPV